MKGSEMNFGFWKPALLALGLTAIATPASAADFTFTVPVAIASVPPEITQFTVECVVTGETTASTVGIGRTTTPMSGGAFSGDVTVEVTASGGADRARASRYMCKLWLSARNPSTREIVTYYINGIGGGGPTFPLATGVRAVFSTSDALPAR
jgi:hypothetical protein